MSNHHEWGTIDGLHAAWYARGQATDPDDGFDEMGDTPEAGVTLLTTADGDGLAIVGAPGDLARKLRDMADKLDAIDPIAVQRDHEDGVVLGLLDIVPAPFGDIQRRAKLRPDTVRESLLRLREAQIARLEHGEGWVLV